MAFAPRQRVALAPLTTLDVGGPARHFAEVASEGEAQEALAWARERGVRVLVLGGGSNLLVADRGVDALVLRLAIRGVEVQASRDGVTRVRVGAGERLGALVDWAVERGLAGVECLAGIPGTVGATPIQNVGAYGQEIASTIAAVRVVDRATGEASALDRDACAFGYRTSAFKATLRDRLVVTAVELALVEGGAPETGYAELRRALAAAGASTPGLRETRDAVLSLRRSKSMVYDPSDPNHRSAGSFFTNPVISEAAADEAEARAALGPGERMPRHAAGEGLVKLSAAWLIERAGLAKGSGEGRVGLSTRHCLAVVNRGGASAAEVVAFAASVRARVSLRLGVELSPEPELVGFDPDELAPLVTRRAPSDRRA